MNFKKKNLIKMATKLSIYFAIFLTTSPLLAGKANGQTLDETKITISLNNANVLDFFRDIERKTNYYFVYDKKIKQNAITLSISKKNISIREILETISLKAKLSFRRINNSISVKISDENNHFRTVVEPVSRIINGKVTDSKGEPIPGVNISVKGTTIGTSSDLDGSFSIDVPTNATFLVFSYLGYITKEVAISDKDLLNIQLMEDINSLDEVVVIGYGSLNKKNVTGSVAKVRKELLEDRPITQASNALQGLIPGVFVNSNSGEAGNDIADIRIRGIGTLNDSNPLILVDGIEAPLNSVNPNDIENINVLKDAASASIYGTRGANGVILVTTKRGVDGAGTINYDAFYGFANPTILPDMVWDNKTYLELYREAAINSGRRINYTDADIERYDNIPSTNWMDVLVKSNAPINNQNISFSGGNKKTRYYFSTGYLEQQGLLAGQNKFNRYSSRLNLDTNIKETVVVGTSISVYKRDGFITPKDNLGGARGFNDKGSTVFSGAMVQHPIAPVFDEFGRYGSFEGRLGIERNRPNGQAVADLESIELDGIDFLGNAYLEYTPFNDFVIKGTIGINSQNDVLRDIKKEYQTYDPVTGAVFTNGNGTRNVGNLLNLKTTKSFNVTNLLQLNYKLKHDKNNFDFLVGFNREKAKIEQSEIQEQGFGTKDVISVGQGTVVTTNGNVGEWSLVSLFGRANYNFDNRYLFEANLRYDASSRFGSNNRWAAFPSFSAGWIISGESFWDKNLISFLKIRGSWGKLGNQSTNLYPFVSQVNLGENYNGNPGGALTRLGNDDLKWEVTTSTNIGLDIRFFKQKIGLEVDYFIKRTDDILTDLSNPFTSGVSLPTTINAASIENKGVEFLVNYNDNFGELKVNLSLNATNIKNKILTLNPELSDNQDRIQLNRSDNVWLIRGEPIFSIYGHQMRGIFQSQEEIDSAPDHSFIGTPKPGDFRYTDLNNDGKIDASDQKVIGNRQPEWLFGANFNLNYKGFELSGILQGIGKAQTWISRMYHPFPFAGIRTFYEENRWTPENPSQTNPRLWVDRRGFNGQSLETADKLISYWVQDRSYIRLKNIQFGYSFPEKIIEKTPFKKLRLYFNGENLWTKTNLKDLDPERFDRESHATAVLPQNKVVSFGINATF